MTRIADIISQVGLHFSLPERANRRRLKLDFVLLVRRGTDDIHSQVGCFCKIEEQGLLNTSCKCEKLKLES